jgi:predicted nucleic acid-binding Zn ribbon protein
VAWPLVCGTAVAQRTRALDFADGVLQVEVPDTGWRNELRILGSQYLAVMNRYVSVPVRRIEFVVSGSVQKAIPARDQT